MDFDASKYGTLKTIVMKIKTDNITKLTSTLILIWLSLLLIGHANEIRVITSQDGRTITARILEKSETAVKIRRVDNAQEFVIPLTNLSESDQKYIRKWQPRNKGYQPSSVALRPPYDPNVKTRPVEYRPRTGGGATARTPRRVFIPGGTLPCAGRRVVRTCP